MLFLGLFVHVLDHTDIDSRHPHSEGEEVKVLGGGGGAVTHIGYLHATTDELVEAAGGAKVLGEG